MRKKGNMIIFTEVKNIILNIIFKNGIKIYNWKLDNLLMFKIRVGIFYLKMV